MRIGRDRASALIADVRAEAAVSDAELPPPAAQNRPLILLGGWP